MDATLLKANLRLEQNAASRRMADIFEPESASQDGSMPGAQNVLLAVFLAGTVFSRS